MRPLPTLLFPLALAACVAPLQGSMRPAPGELSFSPSPTSAKVVFMRPDRWVGGGLNAMLFDGVRGQVFGKSVNDSVFVAELEPGDYLVCPAPLLVDEDRRYGPEWARARGIVAPVTRLSVAAGKTYLVKVAVNWGPVVTALPVRPGSLREELALKELPHLRRSELLPDLPDNPERNLFRDPKVLSRWFDFCLDSSGDDLRLKVRPEDGR